MQQGIKENLLTKETSSSSSSSSNVDRGEDEHLGVKYKIWNESKKLWVVAGPAIFTRFSTFGTTVISQAFIGHIGSIELAAFCLVFTVFVRFSNGILLGMASALETLCGQSYGARKYQMLGVYLQRSWIVLTVTTLFLVPICFFTTPIFEALGQETTISKEAGYISIWTIPVLFAFVVSFTCQMFLQSQSKNMIIVYLSAVTLGIHVLLSWLLTVEFKFGIPGAMVSTIVAFWIPNIGQLLFVTCGGCTETWKGFSTLAFKDLWEMIKLSLSSGVMLCLELWYNTILILLTGNMENAEVSIDALAICLNINGWEMMISLGFLAAAGVRVSNELGKGSSEGAKFSIVVVVITSFAIGFVLFMLFLCLRGRLAYIFTDDEDVVEAVTDLSPLLAFSILLNSIQPVLSVMHFMAQIMSNYKTTKGFNVYHTMKQFVLVFGLETGVAVGTGRQKIVAYVNIVCYYVIGIPVGVVLGYVVDLQVKGVWIGMLFGTLVQTIVLIILTCKTDWEKQVSIARTRVNKWAINDRPELEPET